MYKDKLLMKGMTNQGVTKGMTNEDMTVTSSSSPVIPKRGKHKKENYYICTACGSSCFLTTNQKLDGVNDECVTFVNNCDWKEVTKEEWASTRHNARTS